MERRSSYVLCDLCVLCGYSFIRNALAAGCADGHGYRGGERRSQTIGRERTQRTQREEAGAGVSFAAMGFVVLSGGEIRELVGMSGGSVAIRGSFVGIGGSFVGSSGRRVGVSGNSVGSSASSVRSSGSLVGGSGSLVGIARGVVGSSGSLVGIGRDLVETSGRHVGTARKAVGISGNAVETGKV